MDIVPIDIFIFVVDSWKGLTFGKKENELGGARSKGANGGKEIKGGSFAI
jgi:hypothetical protein